ncbi:hypothetical protein [Brevundimonas sp. Root1423]|uniref:hypothetical protein n=1 Tax=Brevundimonas sp. Root1423 TaxID=1736462 RepID=UPI0006FF8D24|nr:hypothetical protein [Brevundimonas sp. Root1423]KQY96684.1 hypothetical protein ASD25_02285 [Brevundimonas sp. Root1423]
MFAPLLAFALAAVQAAPAPPADTLESYESAMRCAGVMGAKSALFAFNREEEAKARVDRNGRGFVTVATRLAQPLGLTREQLAAAFTASTERALGPITRSRAQPETDAAVAQLNAEHDACILLARSWVAEASGTSSAP